jgi:uncharacterized protein (DUF2141 family)
MKRLLTFGLLLVLLTACSKSKPAYTDNGNPGQIKAVVFYDDNKNGTMDSGEIGAQVEVGISQDVSCPASSMDKITIFNADANGVALMKDIKPGKYCVAVNGNYSMTTKLTQDVYVSSDLVVTVMFGIVKE